MGLKIGHLKIGLFEQNENNNGLVNSNSPRAFVSFLRKAAIVQQWGQQIHTKTPECVKGVQMPHPGDEANGMCPSKEAKNRTQCVNGRNSINSVKNNNKVLDKNVC